MLYFKHSELTEKYHVSRKTIHNWIEATKQNKLDLEIHKINSRTYLANTPKNAIILQQLANKGKKYRNTLNFKEIHPTKDFYDIYSRRQILDIVKNLKVHGEIPRQYNYFKDGANNWDNWLKRLAKDKTSHTLMGTRELITSNFDSIERLLNGNKKINIIDLGAGNGLPVKELLGRLIEKQILHRYIAIDISPSMLELAKHNIEEWYGESARFEGYIRDITYERFDDLLINDTLDDGDDKTINLVLILGSTPVNFRSFDDTFRTIYDSMGSKDLIMYTGKPDTETSRQFFDFNSERGIGKLSVSHRYILTLLNIDDKIYDTEMGFDQVKRMRYVRIKLKTPITIVFDFGDTKTKVSFEKGDTIMLLRAWHLNTLEITSRLKDIGFTLLQLSLTHDRQYFLSICGLEIKQD